MSLALLPHSTGLSLSPRPVHPGGSPGQVLSLGRASFRVCSFATRRISDAPSAPPRTVGWSALLLDANQTLAAGEAEAVQLCQEVPAGPVSMESAREKVVFCDRQGRTRVYQADREHAAASLAACGNAAAASAALLTRLVGRLPVQRLVLPDGEVTLTAEARPAEGGCWRVYQTWEGVEVRVEPARLADHEVAVCTGTLNDYLLVRLQDPAEVEAFSLEQALTLWQQARASFGFQDLLRCRLAAVSTSGPLPVARFFTCGRLHPGAPLTGLAVLGLAACAIDWLAPLRTAGRVRHRRGEDAVPEVRHATCRATIAMSPVDVILGDS